MIYLTFNESVRDLYPKVSEYMCHAKGIETVPMKVRFYASHIFEFIDGETKYYKDRTGADYQYFDEEKVVLALKAVLI